MTTSDIHQHDHHCIELVPLFQGLNDTELKRIDSLVHQRTFQRGEMVFEPGEDLQLKIVEHGAVKEYRLAATGDEQLLRVIEPGEYAGEKAIFGIQNEELYGEAVTETQVCMLRYQDFAELLLQAPELSWRLLQLNVEKAAQTEQQVYYLMIGDIEARLANYLLDQRKIAQADTFKLPMKMKDLAMYLGTTPETLSRKFKSLQERKLVGRQGHQVELLNVDKLEDLYA